MRDTVKVVTCVGNTMGIMPPEIGLNAHKQMKLVAGTEGAFCTVYWNGNRFGDALQARGRAPPPLEPPCNHHLPNMATGSATRCRRKSSPLSTV